MVFALPIWMLKVLLVPASNKNHFREAIVLATKVVHAPGIISELCMSDDPEYVTGYISSLKHGYVRLTPLKDVGNPHGGRIFIFDSRKANIQDTIAYLEEQKSFSPRTAS